MITLYHHPICPFSRQVRIYLDELSIQYNLVKENFWAPSQQYFKICPSGLLPLLILENDDKIVGIYPIIEYLASEYTNFFFMPKAYKLGADTRKHVNWFNEKFYRDVTSIILREKMIALFARARSPRTEHLKIAKENLQIHLSFIASELGSKDFLVNNSISCADISAACQISVLDYFGEINWHKWENLKHWYSLIKSRPGFKSILLDRIPGFNPPAIYSILDF